MGNLCCCLFSSKKENPGGGGIIIPLPNRPKHTIKDFQIIKTLGEGTFGKVVLCIYKKDKKKYAMKILDKNETANQKQQEAVKNERDFMVDLKSPFLLHMKISFQNDKQLFLVSEFMQGGDLNGYVGRQQKGLTEEQAKFILAEVILALEFLHNNHIIFIDLKPENIMIDKNGHIKLADFGSAKKVDEKGYVTEVAGTFEYAAPEIGKSNYEYSVDYFALGCTFFFMLFRSLLFKHNLNKRKRDHNFPNEREYGKVVDEVNKYAKQNRVSNNAKDLMKGLLALNPENRLGYKKEGLKNLKEHDFFEGIDWNNIQKMNSPLDLGLNGENDYKFFEGISHNDLALQDIPDNGDINYRGFSYCGASLISEEPLLKDL